MMIIKNRRCVCKSSTTGLGYQVMGKGYYVHDLLRVWFGGHLAGLTGCAISGLFQLTQQVTSEVLLD